MKTEVEDIIQYIYLSLYEWAEYSLSVKMYPILLWLWFFVKSENLILRDFIWIAMAMPALKALCVSWMQFMRSLFRHKMLALCVLKKP